MSEYNIKMRTLNSEGGYDYIYPKTKAHLTDFDNSNGILAATNTQNAIDEVSNKVFIFENSIDGFIDSTTTFNADGSIMETKSDGSILITVFNSNSSITETLTKRDGTQKAKTTIFNGDGSITEVVS